ncbi:MAG: DUF2585 family protein [bacterium]|nr:DUF2585 family protein [bacterium]
MTWLKTITPKRAVIVVLGLLIIHAIILSIMGQVAVCTCGYVEFWGSPGGVEGSQMIADWYTFSHIIHGFLFYFFIWLINKKWAARFGALLIVAVIVEAAWELFENTDLIINRYRAVTTSIDYFGDSVLNSVADIVWMIVGFIAAKKFPIWLSVFLVIAMEVFVGYAIRDNLTLNILMLVYPLDAVREWQMGG